MREILQLQVGQCGNRIGYDFLEAIAGEHQIDQMGMRINNNNIYQDKIDVYFNHTKSNRYFPRSILMDLQPGCIDHIASKPFAQLYKSQNMICGATGANGNFANGKYSEGQQIIDNVMDAIRRQIQICDSPEGFQITHSITGGTGSGLTALLLSKINTEYPALVKQNFCVVPCDNSYNILSPYNSILTLNQLTKFSSMTILLQNSALQKICIKELKIKQPSFHDLNQLISLGISNITSGLRYPGPLSLSLKKLLTNMTPFQKMHYFSVGTTIPKPTNNYQSKLFNNQLIQESSFHSNNLSGIDARKGRIITGCRIFRGAISQYEAQNDSRWMIHKNSSYFVEWIANNISNYFVNTPPKDCKRSNTFLINSSAINDDFFNKQLTAFSAMYRRKSYVHWLVQNGIDELELVSSQESLKTVSSLYQAYQDYSPPEDIEDLSW